MVSSAFLYMQQLLLNACDIGLILSFGGWMDCFFPPNQQWTENGGHSRVACIVFFFCFFFPLLQLATCPSLLEIIVQRYLEEALTQFVFFKSRWKSDTSQRTGVLWLSRDHTCTVYVKVWKHIPYIMIFNKPVRAWLHSRLTNWTC